MKNVYKVTFDIKVGRNWLGGGNPNGFSSRNVVTSGDVRDACYRVQRDEFSKVYEGDKKAVAIRFLSVTLIVGDVL